LGAAFVGAAFGHLAAFGHPPTLLVVASFLGTHLPFFWICFQRFQDSHHFGLFGLH
jgi:hypothetical protein